jgi:hypothetical protein
MNAREAGSTVPAWRVRPDAPNTVELMDVGEKEKALQYAFGA